MIAPRVVALAALAAALVGCDAEQGELRTWMEEARRNAAPVREKVAEPKRFEPFRYSASGQVDPFSPAKLKPGAAGIAAARGEGPRPDPKRRKEALESYPLDALKMVGHLRRGGSNVALVQADTLLYQVRVGNFVGQNHGRVLRISEDEVAVKEIVQDAAGDWVERETALRLQVQESRK